MYVYLIKNGDLHKIGVTGDLDRRMKQLKPDRIIWTVEPTNPSALESFLHRKFAPKRLPQTEYFRLSDDEVIAAIIEMKNADRKNSEAANEASTQGLLDDKQGVISDNVEPFLAPPSETETAEAAEGGNQLSFDDTEHFRVLGWADKNVIFQRKATNEVIEVKRNTLNRLPELIRLAPLDWWEKHYRNRGPEARLEIMSSLIRASEERGFFDWKKRSVGRGAHRDSEGHIYFNCGDRLLVARGESKKCNQEASDDEVKDVVFLPGPCIHTRMEIKEEDAVRVRRRFAQAVMRYRWADPISGRAFIGWIATSLFGGALTHRPALWLSGSTATGKTWLFSNVLRPIFRESFYPIVDPTPDGLIEMTKNDSLPVCIDDAEPLTSKDGRQRWDEMLNIVRVSTGGTSAHLWVKGASTQSQSSDFVPRFSVLLVSIKRPNLGEAGLSHIFQIKLSSKSVDDWISVRDGILTSLAEGRAQMIRSSIIDNIPELVEKTMDIADTIGRTHSLGTREAQSAAALTAGFNFLSGESELVLQEKTVAPDPYRILRRLIGGAVRVPGMTALTITDCLKSEDPAIQEIAVRHGFRLTEEGELLIAAGEPMATLLKKLDLDYINIREHLRGLPGVRHSRSLPNDPRKTFGPFKRQRYYLFSPDITREIGLSRELDEEE